MNRITRGHDIFYFMLSARIILAQFWPIVSTQHLHRLFGKQSAKGAPSVAIIVPSVYTCRSIFFVKKTPPFRIITIHKGDVSDTSTRHNSYVRMTETGTKGLEYRHSQPFQAPLCDEILFDFLDCKSSRSILL